MEIFYIFNLLIYYYNNMKKIIILYFLFFTFLMFNLSYSYTEFYIETKLSVEEQENYKKQVGKIFLWIDKKIWNLPLKKQEQFIISILIKLDNSISNDKKISDKKKYILSYLKYNFEQKMMNNGWLPARKITNAYISGEIEAVWENEINYMDNTTDKTTLKKLSGTSYFKDKNHSYFNMMELDKIYDLDPKKIKWVLPYKWFTGETWFATDWKDLYFKGDKVEDWDINTLKFSDFWAWDKNNLYLTWTIIKWVKIDELLKISDNCFKDKINIICNFFEWWWTKYHIIEWADLKTFKEIVYPRYKDKNFVYLYWSKIELIDVNSFKIIDDNYTKDKNNVYYHWAVVDLANPKSFKVLKWHIAKDDKKIYSNWIVIKDIDYNSFLIDLNIIKDNKKVYTISPHYWLEIVEINWVDVWTFQWIKSSYGDNDRVIYAKDKNNVYVVSNSDGFKVIIWADVNTFKIVENEDTPYNKLNAVSSFSKDKNNIYYFWKIIEWIDVASFQLMNDFYIKDKNYVFVFVIRYNNYRIISWADPKTFWRLTTWFISSRYTKDKNNIYYDEKIVFWIDINTFMAIDNYYAKDKNNVYYNGEKINWESPNWFDLEKYLKNKKK